jgi:deoxyadenosine/deoxycytidine kinase
MSSNCTIISIEGNIGSGKSTLLANLREYFKTNDNVVFLKEPVDEWEKIKDKNGVTILEKFYADQEKYSFPFQMMAYVSRIKVLRDTLREKIEKNRITNKENQHFIIITERSLHTDKMVFAKMLYDTGKIEYINYQIYLNWFDTFSSEFPVHKVVYVKTSPKKCYERISKRSREGEDNIPLKYLESCSLYHDNMLDKKLITCVCENQLVLNGNIDIYENKEQVNKWIEEIIKFIVN